MTLTLVVLALAIEAVYVFIVSAGHIGSWPTYMTYYDLQAEGFRAGHLHLSIEPRPELLAQPNPYDPANLNLWVWDISLHGGHYYLYWGPLPALLQAGAKTLLRISREIGDQYLVFAFYSLSLLAAVLLLRRLAARLFADLPRWALPVGVIAFAFANPTLHLLASAGTYQAAIVGGQGFLLLGCFFAFGAVSSGEVAADRRRELWLAGSAWGLALACRISLAPAIGLVAASTVAFARARAPGTGLRARAFDLAAVAAPIAAVVAALLLYNRLRFDQWLEFGTNNQLSTLKFRYSTRYWLANLFAYLLRPVARSCRFPWAIELLGTRGFPSWLRLPDDYLTGEPVAGLLLVVPIAWAGVIAIGHAVSGVRKRSTSRPYLWSVCALLIAGTLTGMPELGLYMPTMRYLGDVTPALALLGVLGGWTLLVQAPRTLAWRVVVGGGFVALAAATAIFGLLLGYQGYTGHFQRFNPELDARLTSALSSCPPREPSP